MIRVDSDFLNKHGLPGSIGVLLIIFVGSEWIPIAWSISPALNPQNPPSPLAVKRLLCEYESEPDSIDRKHPRFSWILDSDIRGQRQTAYQILVSRSEETLANDRGDSWNSGKISSSQTAHIPYQGNALESNTRYFWKVIIWDKHGSKTISRPSAFWTSYLHPEDWTAQWIGAGPRQELRSATGFYDHVPKQNGPENTLPHNGRSLLLRREFDCQNAIKNARVFVTGLGYYELYLNGRKVSDHVLAPAKTNYRKQVLYDTYDVTHDLKMGGNAVGIHLGNGWFNPYPKWWRPYRMQWFGAKRAMMQLVIEYHHGEKAVIATDASWKHAPGPVLFSCVYDGEVYDANCEQPGWTDAGFDDSQWEPVSLVEEPGGRLISHTMQPIRVTEERIPKRISNAGHSQVFDMGQNFAGWVRIAMQGTQGTKVVLRFAEDLHDDGTIDVTSNEHAQATATYILKGGGIEVYEPRFTFFGFRYVEIRGEPELPSLQSVRGCVVHSACEITGTFECGNSLINQVHRATLWSQRSNMLGYPLDCPQRDERLGWLGDAQVTAQEAMFNLDMPRFYRNWLGGIQASQDAATGDLPIISPRPYIRDEGVEWSSSYIIIAWHYYLHYGDPEILAEHYPAMKRYLQFLGSLSNQGILKKGWIGDWGSLVEGWQEGDPASVPTAFYYYDAVLLSRIARVLGKTNDANEFSALAEQIRQAYHKTYFHSETGYYEDGSQMANAFPLFLGIVPAEYQDRVLDHLITDIVTTHENHLTTGVLGSKYLIDALVQAGRADVAYGLAIQTGYPSWAAMVEKYTTLCEFWNLKQSHNHVMMGSIDTFFYQALAGIQIDERHPGFEHIVIRPFVPETLPYAKAAVETIRGQVVSEWTQNDAACQYHIMLPANTTADVYLPVEDIASVSEGGVPATRSTGVKLNHCADGTAWFTIASGNYTFVVKHSRRSLRERNE
ncbi:MAG: family 78 glycoside hydrolase catalytic domain [Pirellulales bacterium]|nr:family 78 glycoside hydrolase catalytic domain [Pirellulales bacterium]